MKIVYLFCFILICAACHESTSFQQIDNNVIEKSPKYAKRFNVKVGNDYSILELFGNKENNQVTTSFVLYSGGKPNLNLEAYYIKVPVKKIASMSSIYSAMISKLNEGKSIIAIDNVDYYNDSFIVSQVQKGIIKEVSKGLSIEIEKTIAAKPDLILTFGEGNVKKDLNPQLTSAKIPVAISIDHLEETPLARAEWIKFISCFLKKESLADSLFSQTENRYLQLQSLIKDKSNRPTVLTEIKYGDAWYVPAGKSYIANLLSDAGANYYWYDDIHTGSLPLSFESVYLKAKDCDFWINLYNVNSKKELIGYDERYELFKAYRMNHLYNNNKIQNPKGYSNYWETGIVNPDDLLKDLIYIFYPSVLSNHNLKYYKILN